MGSVFLLLLVMVLPVVLFTCLDFMCRGELPASVRRVARWVARRVVRRAPRTHHAPPADVFDTLWVQWRLSAVADEIVRLENDPSVFARASRLHASRRAYDDLLADACRLAGVGLAGARIGEGERADAELELASRGWSW